MMRRGVLHALAIGIVTLAIVLGAIGLGGAEARSAVYFGASVAFVFQAAAFWILSLWLLRERPLTAYLVQMVGRVVVLAGTALVLLPRVGFSAAPALLALAAVFFVTTLIEPVFLNARSSTAN